MRAKSKFLKMYNKLPENARTELAIYWYVFDTPTMSLSVVASEVRHDTDFGRKALKDLGYEDD
jgi:hypothetical protein